MPSRFRKSKKRHEPRKHKHRHHSHFATSVPISQPDGDERIPVPSIIEFKIPWDILDTYLRPLVTNRSLRNEFSGAIHRADEHHHAHESGVEHVESEHCSTEFVCMQRATIVHGSGDSAAFFEDIPYTYHTHPIYYYKEYGVRIAPPSGEDIGVFLRGCVEDRSCVHFVIAKEGIYYIIPNPCFIHQARRLKRRDFRKYNIAMIGAEILGMQTHECRESWIPERWLDWVRGRFVCGRMLVDEYEDEIRHKFGHHCTSCTPLSDVIGNFQTEFRSIVDEFQLNMCQYMNPVMQAQWGEGNWLDVGFSKWSDIEAAKGLHVKYSVF